MSTKANVTAAKPKKTGSVYAAPVGTALPTDAVTALNEAFKGLGYVSQDGVTNSNSPENPVKAWGGDKVLSGGRKDTFKVKLIEAMNADVLGVVHGADNVTGTIATGITVAVNDNERDNLAYVIDMFMRDGAFKRIVIPSAEIESVGDVVYKEGEPVGYELTLSCEFDDSGNSHYEYMKAAAAGG